MGGWTVFHFSTTVVRPTGGTWGGWEYGLPFGPSVPDETGQYFLSQEIFDAAGSKLRSIYVAYERDRIPTDHGEVPQHWYHTNRRLVREKNRV
jgi:hypothetical protein